MMTEIQILEGQKGVSSLEGTTLKKTCPTALKLVLNRSYFSSDRIVPSAAEKLEKKRTVQLDASTVEIEERGVKLRLTVVDTPGFGDTIDNTDSFQQIIRYIDDQFERYVWRQRLPSPCKMLKNTQSWTYIKHFHVCYEEFYLE